MEAWQLSASSVVEEPVMEGMEEAAPPLRELKLSF
jgi:hypothetical protein